MAVPIGNPAGANQANPALQSTSLTSPVPMGASTTPAPIPGGTTPSSTNPYLIGGGVPGAATSGSAVSGSPALPTNFSYSSDPTTLPGQDAGQAALLSKQFVDIAGKGVGGQLAQQYSGMAGTDSAIFNQWLQGQAPVWAKQQAGLEQTLGTAGVSPNSTVAALGLADMGAQQAAQAGSMNAQLMQQNQQNQLGILQGMQGAAEQEVASSGWDVFGQVMGDVGQLAGTVMGLPGGSVGGQMFGKLFGGGAGAVPGAINTAGLGSSDLPSASLSSVFGNTQPNVVQG